MMGVGKMCDFLGRLVRVDPYTANFPIFPGSCLFLRVRDPPPCYRCVLFVVELLTVAIPIF